MYYEYETKGQDVVYEITRNSRQKKIPHIDSQDIKLTDIKNKKSSFSFYNGHFSPIKSVPKAAKKIVEPITAKNFISKYNEDLTKNNLMRLFAGGVTQAYLNKTSQIDARQEITQRAILKRQKSKHVQFDLKFPMLSPKSDAVISPKKSPLQSQNSVKNEMCEKYQHIKCSEQESHKLSMFEPEKQQKRSILDYAQEIRKMKNQYFSPRNYNRSSQALSSQASRSTNQSSYMQKSFKKIESDKPNCKSYLFSPMIKKKQILRKASVYSKGQIL